MVYEFHVNFRPIGPAGFNTFSTAEEGTLERILKKPDITVKGWF